MGLKRAIVRPVASEASPDESLFDSPEFVTRLTRVAQLWHYVLVSRVLVYFACAFFPGLPGFFDRPSQWLLLALGIGCAALTGPRARCSSDTHDDAPAHLREKDRAQLHVLAALPDRLCKRCSSGGCSSLC